MDRKNLGISMKKTHIKYGKETYIGGKKNNDGRNTCLKKIKIKSIFVNYVGKK
jgi:hypothetical protein